MLFVVHLAVNSPGHDQVVLVAHSPCGFDDFPFVIRNDLDSFQLDPEGKTILGEIGRVGVNDLDNLILAIAGEPDRHISPSHTYLASQYLIADDDASGRMDRAFACLLNQ